MSMPLFREAVATERYVEPDYDQIEREQDEVDSGQQAVAAPSEYRPSKVSDDELSRIKEEMRLNRVQITPDTLRHALEAEEIRKFLRSQGIRSVRKVAGTRDCRGLVKLDFEEFRRLVEKLLSTPPPAEGD